MLLLCLKNGGKIFCVTIGLRIEFTISAIKTVTISGSE